MSYNQYYGGQENYMSMPNNQPYYQPTAMSPRPQTSTMSPSGPINQLPQTNQMVPFNQVPQTNAIPQTNPLPQANQFPQYQYANNSAVNYSPSNNPLMQNPITPGQYNMQSGMMGRAPSNTQNYSSVPINQSQFPVMQQNQNSNAPYPNSNAYPANTQIGYNNIPQTSNVPGVLNTTGFNNNQQYGVPMPQQLPYSTNNTVQQVAQAPSTQTQPVYGGEPYNIQTSQNPVHASQGEKQEETSSFKPTYVIGQYKCSDFPTLFTGSYRYPGTPIQRKPFTMKESMRGHACPDRRGSMGLNKYGKRWELRGGKYYGCFTSRTNGLQDICPKAKCRLCPNDNKKK